MYKSDRDIPLICQDHNKDYPIITVENYCKWYDIYVIFPDKSVRKADASIIDDMVLASSRVLLYDHAFHPSLLVIYAAMTKGRVDGCSLEAVAGRWIAEYYEKDLLTI